jgi:hypothetical protein
MDRLIELNAKLESLLAHGRDANPLFSPKARAGIRKLDGLNRTRKVAIKSIISPQATIHTEQVKSMAKGIRNGKEGSGKPTLQHRGNGVYACLDGNHRINAAMLAGKRKVEAYVQR